MDLSEIYKTAAEDSTLFSSIDVDALIDKIEENHYLENKTVAEISKEIFEAIHSLGQSESMTSNRDIEQICLRLSGYRLVDRVCDLRNGQLVRWIKKNQSRLNLTNGGLLVNVKIENVGVKLLCKNNMNRFFSIFFDDCLVFQKMTMDEQLILMASGQEEQEQEECPK